MAHHVIFGDFMAGNFLAGDFLTRIPKMVICLFDGNGVLLLKLLIQLNINSQKWNNFNLQSHKI